MKQRLLSLIGIVMVLFLVPGNGWGQTITLIPDEMASRRCQVNSITSDLTSSWVEQLLQLRTRLRSRFPRR